MALIRRLLQDLENALRFGFLVGRQWLGGHGYEISDCPSSSPKGGNFPPTLQLLTRQPTGPPIFVDNSVIPVLF
jgi:hypothetical protein